MLVEYFIKDVPEGAAVIYNDMRCYKVTKRSIGSGFYLEAADEKSSNTFWRRNGTISSSWKSKGFNKYWSVGGSARCYMETEPKEFVDETYLFPDAYNL